MRGGGDQLSIGERIAFYRRRRGLSQVVLAGLMGKSEDWVSKIERGERQVNRVEVLVELARQLRVTLNDLLGEPPVSGAKSSPLMALAERCRAVR